MWELLRAWITTIKIAASVHQVFPATAGSKRFLMNTYLGTRCHFSCLEWHLNVHNLLFHNVSKNVQQCAVYAPEELVMGAVGLGYGQAGLSTVVLVFVTWAPYVITTSESNRSDSNCTHRQNKRRRDKREKQNNFFLCVCVCLYVCWIIMSTLSWI